MTEAVAHEIRDRAQVVLQMRHPPTGASWEQIKTNYVNMSKHIEEQARQMRRAGVASSRAGTERSLGPLSSEDAAAAAARRARRGVRRAGVGAGRAGVVDGRKAFEQQQTTSGMERGEVSATTNPMAARGER